MNIRIVVSKVLRQALQKAIEGAVRSMNYRLVKRIEIILDVFDGHSFEESAERFGVHVRSVIGYVTSFIRKGMASLKYKSPPGRPSRLSKTQKKELCERIDAGPAANGYDYGRWNSVLIADLIEKHFGKVYHPHYVAELLKNLGYSYQKARFEAERSEEVKQKRLHWESETWPALLAAAKAKQALLLFGDEASFAQWGSLSFTWAKRGQQPVVKTCGKRKAYKVFGLIEYFSGAFFSKTLMQGKFTSDSYRTFLSEVLAKTTQHLFLIQDGARYHTSAAMKAFFAAHQDRLTVFDLPPYSPDFNPIEYLWRNLKSQATHLRYFPTFHDLVHKVDDKLAQFARLPKDILALMGKYCRSLALDDSTFSLPIPLAVENLFL
jgi:transposase